MVETTFLSLSRRKKHLLPPVFLGQSQIRCPECMIEYFLKKYTRLGDIVLDPFAGFGTTLIVAEKLGRIAYGIECDERRVDYVRKKISDPERLIEGDSRRLSKYELPPVSFSITSPPFASAKTEHDPLTSYTTPLKGYSSYLKEMRKIYTQLKDRLIDGGRAVIEVSNVKEESITPLAWDLGREISKILTFEGEIVIGWKEGYAYGYDHSYCLVFRK